MEEVSATGMRPHVLRRAAAVSGRRHARDHSLGGAAALLVLLIVATGSVDAAPSKKLPPTAPVPELRPEQLLDQGLTFDKPPIPAIRPEADRRALSPATSRNVLDEGLTSAQPPVPKGRPEPPRTFNPPARAPAAGNVLDEQLTSAEPPLPRPRPDPARGDGGFIGPPAPAAVAKPPPRPVVPAQELAACIAGLEKLDATFSRQPPISDPAGCEVQNPVMLSALGNGIELTPPALLDCPMALAAVSFVKEIAAPAARRDLGADLTAIGQASGYVCRSRNGTAKLSEHAYGNALDIAGFVLAGGRQVDVKAGPPEPDAKFLDALRKAACGPFKTVLGPGSDADHALHFHFDLAPRRSGSTFCQ